MGLRNWFQERNPHTHRSQELQPLSYQSNFLKGLQNSFSFPGPNEVGDLQGKRKNRFLPMYPTPWNFKRSGHFKLLVLQLNTG